MPQRMACMPWKPNRLNFRFSRSNLLLYISVSLGSFMKYLHIRPLTNTDFINSLNPLNNMSRAINFSAGPGVLPLEVLKKAQEELVDYRGAGMSVMEMSHRSKEYEAIIGGAEKNLRKLMNIPANYKVLFLQGGASMQFAQVLLSTPDDGLILF